MNEPGPVWSLSIWPGFEDKKYLQPMYDEVAAAIRGVDPTRLIMFEPTTWSDEFDSRLFDTKFTHAPGGAQFANLSAYAFHYYSGIDLGGQIHYVAQRLADAKRLHTGSFVTEWGFHEPPCPAPPLTNASDCYSKEMDVFDGTNALSWTMWNYKSLLPEADETPFVATCTGCLNAMWRNQTANADGIYTPNWPSALALARSYPLQVQGHAHAYSFDWLAGGRFELAYELDPGVDGPTLIYVNTRLGLPTPADDQNPDVPPWFTYPHGVNVTLSGDGDATWAWAKGATDTIAVSSTTTQKINVTVVIEPVGKEQRFASRSASMSTPPDTGLATIPVGKVTRPDS